MRFPSRNSENPPPPISGRRQRKKKPQIPDQKKKKPPGQKSWHSEKPGERALAQNKNAHPRESFHSMPQLPSLRLQNKCPEARKNELIINDTKCSQAVTHPRTDHTQSCLTAHRRREAKLSTRYSHTNCLKKKKRTGTDRIKVLLWRHRTMGENTELYVNSPLDSEYIDI